MYELIIDGPPIALQRHRHARGRTYDPQSIGKKDLLVRLAPILKQYPCLDCALSVEFIFNFKPPKSKSKKWKRENRYKTTRSDLDNMVKYYSDWANGTLWVDDSIIVDLHAVKRYSETAYTLIRWEEIY
jgi:Holliday junction resolvase RusA-like endonuclease